MLCTVATVNQREIATQIGNNQRKQVKHRYPKEFWLHDLMMTIIEYTKMLTNLMGEPLYIRELIINISYFKFFH